MSRWSCINEIDPGISGLPSGRPRAAAAWRYAAGSSLARRLPVLARRGDTLEIAVPGARWAALLERLAPDLIQRLGKHRGGRGVRRLVSREVLPAQPSRPAAEPRLTGTPSQKIEALARRLAGGRTPDSSGRE